MRVLGVNAVFHDPAAAVIVDGTTVAAAEEERFNRRKHGKRPVPFSAWELPERAIRWCLAEAGLSPADIDAVAYSYDPSLVHHDRKSADPEWERTRTTYAQRAPRFLASAVPGLERAEFRFVPHHVAHAASAGLAAPAGPRFHGNGAPMAGDRAVLVADGRGESASSLAGVYRNGKLDVLAEQPLPHSLGLMYEDLTQHLGFLRSSDEYKVMALASYGTPRFVEELRARVHATGDGGFVTEPGDWNQWAPPRPAGGEVSQAHADLAASVQSCLEEVLLELVSWLHERTGQTRLAMAGGTALNCVANTRVAADGPFSEVWVQPAAGDAGTALGAALHHAAESGERVAPMPGADLGRWWDDDEIASLLHDAAVPFERPDDVADTVAAALADDAMVAWFQGRAEFGPRALGRRSLLAHPGRLDNVERLNAVKGREQFRPVAPMVRGDRAGEIFTRGPLPSPYMLFVHDVEPAWRDRVPAVVHVDGTARVQTVDDATEPLLGRLLDRFEARTGLPLVINTSLNTAGRPMVDSPRDALECFGATPVDVLAIGPFVVRRGRAFEGRSA